MLEPLHACNLTCTGCGRIREYETTITAARAAGAVPDGGGRVRRADGLHLRRRADAVSGDRRAGRRQILERGKHIYLCTNGMFIEKRLNEFTPDRRFFFNVHLDGMEKNHDIAVEREGVFKAAIEGIKAAKAAGFKVCTNTTVYKETDMKEIEELFEFLRAVRRGRPPDLPGLRLLRGERSRDLHDARRHPREVQGHRPAGQALHDQQHADVPGLPARASANCPAPPGAIRPTTSRAGKAPAT